MFKKSKECLPWVPKTINARSLVTVKSLLTPEKSFFLTASPLVTSACDRHRTIQQQARKISGTKGKQAVQLAETGQGRLALTTNKRFEISAFISFHVEQYISSTQADKTQFLSAKLTRASLFSFVSLFNRHVFSCRHCCHNNRVTSAR